MRDVAEVGHSGVDWPHVFVKLSAAFCTVDRGRVHSRVKRKGVCAHAHACVCVWACLSIPVWTNP